MKDIEGQMQKYFNIIFIILLFISCTKTNNKSNPVFQKQGTVKIFNAFEEEIIFDVELAEDDFKRARGLMFRYSLEPNQGMFFLFDYQTTQSFWMRNTYLSLDMLFIDENFMIVDIHENAFPLSEELIESKVPAKYVLEILGGKSKSLKINIGDRVLFEKNENR